MTSELRALVKQQNLLYYDKMKAEPTAHTFIVRHVPWKVAAGKLTAPQPCIHLCDRAFIIEALSNPFTSNRFVASIHGCLAHCSIDSADSYIRRLHWLQYVPFYALTVRAGGHTRMDKVVFPLTIAKRGQHTSTICLCSQI